MTIATNNTNPGKNLEMGQDQPFGEQHFQWYQRPVHCGYHSLGKQGKRILSPCQTLFPSCHCEECSDEAISNMAGKDCHVGKPPRNDRLKAHLKAIKICVCPAWESLTDTLLKSICRTKWLGRTN